MHRFCIAARRARMPRKGRKISRWCNRANIKPSDILLLWTPIHRGSDSMSKRNERSRVGTHRGSAQGGAAVTGRDRSFIFLSVVTAITRLRTVIDNAYLGLRGLLNAFGIRYPEQCSKHPASEHKIIPPHSIQPCSINRFDQQTRIPRRSPYHSA